jgi:hypothetical protein
MIMMPAVSMDSTSNMNRASDPTSQVPPDGRKNA